MNYIITYTKYGCVFRARRGTKSAAAELARDLKSSNNLRPVDVSIYKV